MGQLRGEMGRLREDLHSSNDQLRADLNSSTQQLRVEVNQFRSELTGRMDGQFHWLLGTIFTSWVTLLLVIFFRS
jgi:hypothetical protein